MKTLFICKKNENYGYSTTGKRSGLYNSTRFVADAIGAEVVEVQDNNEIDREVARVRPDAVVIEALWVVPEKFDVLKRLHPSVKWFVHIHSNIPFLAYEGVAVDWLKRYIAKGVKIIANSPQAHFALTTFLPARDVLLLANVYPITPEPMKAPGPIFNVGCFGAIRPMKNQLIQAIAAMKFARDNYLLLAFFVNASRSETGGDPILRNLRALFQGTPHTLVEMPWMEHEDFLKLLREQIHMSLQVSLSETFNIVTADAVASGVPVVTSDEVPWVTPQSKARADNVDDITTQMSAVYDSAWLVANNQVRLSLYSHNAAKAWRRQFTP